MKNLRCMNNICLLMLICFLIPSVKSFGDDLDVFELDVNTAWSSTNDAQIVVLINQRLNLDSDDATALSTKMHYHMWVDGNITNAQLIASQLDLVVQTSTNQLAKNIFFEMKAEVDSIPLGESGVMPAATLNSLRQELRGVFPGIKKSIWLGRVLFE